MDQEIRKRLEWVKLYQATKNAGLTCSRCGISRPTLRKWAKRYEEFGIDGLESKSRRPHHSPEIRITETVEKQILSLRKEKNLGARRIQNELECLYDFHLSIASIHKILKRRNVPPLHRPRRPAKPKRYAKSLPGECVQLDTVKIATGIYQYTAIDDYSRFLVAEIYPSLTAAHTLEFLDFVLDAIPFAIQRIQTDRGGEFMAMKVQRFLKESCIKYRPVKPRSPHLNGKVERVQRTILEEFYAFANLKSEALSEELGVWTMYYNYQRIHGSLGKPPVEKLCERIHDAPFWDDVIDAYDPAKERIRERDYALDQQVEAARRKKSPAPSS